MIQLSRDRIAYYEPALKIWHHQGNFNQGICVVLEQASNTERRLALESSLIRSYQPSLNAPWVGQLLSRSCKTFSGIGKATYRPPRTTSLTLLPAAHDLRTEVRLLIREIIRMERCNFPPLFNYRSFMKNWSRNASVKCTCINFHSRCKTAAIIS